MEKQLKKIEPSVTKIPRANTIRPVDFNTLTPEYIVGRLFSFHNTAHFYHFQTDNHAAHKALHHLYEELVHLKDEIPEFLLGCQVPKRFEYITLDEIPTYNETALLNFLEQGYAFAKGLAQYGDNNGWEALEDMAAKLQKVFNHTKLLISYK